jgi:Domain of Unknown Function with PDB structure (DUF3858)/Domain of Unknown Function with PDB structure (DUF3857)
MKIQHWVSSVACFLLSQNVAVAQTKSNIKFGKITIQDFNLSAHSFDSSASAIILADIGDCYYNMGTMINTRHRRMKIINNKGFNIANIEIPLYVNGMHGQHITNLKANTYNIENGQIQEIKLDSKSTYTEHVVDNFEFKKFTFPAIKEGSIIEYSYQIESPINFNISTWEFQGRYPCLWSEFSASIPEYFNFVFLSQGYLPYYIKPKDDPQYHGDYRWVMKDVPAIKDEPYTTTISNHIAKIEFQLSSIWMSGRLTDILSNWPKIGKLLMEDVYFGADIGKNNGWMDDEMISITAGAHSDLEKARKIFRFVRDNFSSKSSSGIYASTALKTVFKNRSGTEAEINLLLSAMLNHEKILSKPVILSTRPHGYTNELYPLMTRYNYVVCYASIDSSDCFLDASVSVNGFNHLPDYCYNGQARIVDEENPVPVYFTPDSLREQKITNVLIINDEKGNLTGSFQSTLGYCESFELREKIKKKSEGDFSKEFVAGIGPDIRIGQVEMDSLAKLEDRIKIHFDFDMKPFSGEDIIYFNPMFTEGRVENPFKALDRQYPVEMPYAIDKTYLLEMEIPAGYTIEELPKSAQMSLNENDGYFEYLVQKSDHSIQMRSRIKLNKTFFSPEEYTLLRDFYTTVLKKQSEMIVFKRKSRA